VRITIVTWETEWSGKLLARCPIRRQTYSFLENSHHGQRLESPCHVWPLLLVQIILLTVIRSFNRYAQVAARALRSSLKEEQRLAAEKRGTTSLRYQQWENGQGGPQVCLSSVHHLPFSQLSSDYFERGREGCIEIALDPALILHLVRTFPSIALLLPFDTISQQTPGIKLMQTVRFWRRLQRVLFAGTQYRWYWSGNPQNQQAWKVNAQFGTLLLPGCEYARFSCRFTSPWGKKYYHMEYPHPPHKSWVNWISEHKSDKV